jgi:THO complex subunit 2
MKPLGKYSRSNFRTFHLTSVSPGFYVTFWQLSTYDLSPPSARYDEEGAALLASSRQEDQKYNAADRSGDRARRSTASSHRTRRERYLNTAMQLTQELKEQTASRAFTLKRLTREKQHWFSHCTSFDTTCLEHCKIRHVAPKAQTLVGSIIEHCLQPRCLLSPMDADFCAQFIKVLHTQGTPGFHTLMCYDKVWLIGLIVIYESHFHTRSFIAPWRPC